MRSVTSRRAARVGALACSVGLLAALSGCSSDGSNSGTAPTTPSSAAASGQTSSSASTAQLDVAPAVADGQQISANDPIVVRVAAGTLTKMTVTDHTGANVPGTMNTAAGTWTPSEPLVGLATYKVTATATAPDGKTSTVARTLTTKPTAANLQITSMTPTGSLELGDAQPIVVHFNNPVAAKDRAAVQQAVKVSDARNVEGAFRWISPTRLDYRPRTYWPMGDHVTVAANLDGVTTNGVKAVPGALNADFTVTSDLKAVVDLKKFEMTVTEGGKVVRTMKIGSGKKDFESLTGSMVVLGKSTSVRMTSCSVGFGCSTSSPNYYDEIIHDAVQTTPTGTYLHAAPWDNLIGRANTSHGCIHLTQADASWFYQHVEVGDEVKVIGDGNLIKPTNGEPDWTLSWQEWTAPSNV